MKCIYLCRYGHRFEVVTEKVKETSICPKTHFQYEYLKSNNKSGGPKKCLQRGRLLSIRGS